MPRTEYSNLLVCSIQIQQYHSSTHKFTEFLKFSMIGNESVGDEGEAENETKTATEFFNMEFADFLSLVDQHIESWDAEPCYSWDSYVDVAEGVEIPSSLLLGPWTDDMIRHLYWLIKGNARIDWITSTSGEVFHSSYASYGCKD